MVPIADWNEVLNSNWAKSVVTILGSIGAVGTAVWWVLSRFYRDRFKNLTQQAKSHRSQLADSQKTAQAGHHSLALLQQSHEQQSLEIAGAHTRIEKALLLLSQAKDKEVRYLQEGQRLLMQRNQLRIELAHHKGLSDTLVSQVTDRDGQLQTVRTELDERRRELDRGERRIRRAIQLDGFLWTAKALQRVPRFRPQSERRQAILSVVNLKGGVGKTTVAANLGATFARRGYRVLFVDLDLQGSLTDILLPLDKIKMLHANASLAQHFFEAASMTPTTKLGDFVQSVCRFPDGGAVDLLGASDNLGYTELTLTLRWLLKQGKSDNRFLLRRALHRPAISKNYDIVMIDCPPLVNISCINALAASDHVVVPVTLDSRATERVPVLLKRVLGSEKFRKYINCDLKILGVVANRTYRENLTLAETEAWNQLGSRCRDASGEEVRRFETTIPISNEARESNDLLEDKPPNSKAALTFAALADEIEQELPRECRRHTAALS